VTPEEQCLSATSLSQEASRDALLELFYRFFDPAHSCVLPQQYLKQKMDLNVSGMALLLCVVQYIGSIYSPAVPSAPFEDEIKRMLAEERPHTSGFEIQALLLYCIAVYWHDDRSRARALRDEAVRKAVSIGMNFKEFATYASSRDAVLAESWRRTWWQLYLTDGHITAIDHGSTHISSQSLIPCTVELPCEDAEYKSGVS